MEVPSLQLQVNIERGGGHHSSFAGVLSSLVFRVGSAANDPVESRKKSRFSARVALGTDTSGLRAFSAGWDRCQPTTLEASSPGRSK